MVAISAAPIFPAARSTLGAPSSPAARSASPAPNFRRHGPLRRLPGSPASTAPSLVMPTRIFLARLAALRREALEEGSIPGIGLPDPWHAHSASDQVIRYIWARPTANRPSRGLAVGLASMIDHAR